MTAVLNSVKKYWPWALGIVGIGWLLTRQSGAQDPGFIGYGGVAPVDPAIAQASIQASTQLQMAAIDAQAKRDIAELQTLSNMSGTLAALNNSFTDAQIEGYRAMKETSISAMTNAGQITAAGLMAGGAAQQSYNQAVGQSNAAAASLIGAVGQANAQSANAIGGLLGAGFGAAFGKPPVFIF